MMKIISDISLEGMATKNKQIDKNEKLEVKKMFVIIVGCGRIGKMLALQLSQIGHNVTVVERDKAKLNELGGGFNGVVIEGLGIDEDILVKAGIEKADTLLAVSQEDNINIMCAQIATQVFKVPKVIARNYNPEMNDFYKKLGLDVICTPTSTVDTIVSKIVYPNFEVISQLKEEGILFIRINLDEMWVGVPITQLEEDYTIKILQVRRNNRLVKLSTNETLIKGDILLVSIEEENMFKLNELSNK